MDFALQKAKTQAVLFWGSLKEYSPFAKWPKNDNIVFVSKRLKEDAKGFLSALKESKEGFYFLNSETDLEFLRAWDFRNGTEKGLTLMLASIFEDKSTYIQAKGRVLRGNDEGSIYTLPR